MRLLRIYLLGSFQITLTSQSTESDEAVSGFGYDKVRALLAYLAVEHHRPHSREWLGALLWPEADTQTARMNLRKALSTLRKALDLEVSPSYLIIQNDTVQFNPNSSFWLDVEQLTTRLDAALHHDHLQFESIVPALEEAAALYKGCFLQGLSVDSLPFEDWMTGLRENLHTRMMSGLYELSRFCLHHGQYPRAQKHALHMLELEPYSEDAHRLLIESLAKSGQRSAALAQYEQCRALLAEELGVEPASETLNLYQRIRSVGSARTHNLPSQHGFVGRHMERNELAQLLARPECRLLTVVGMGGMGKTSLAIRAARDCLDAFWHGVFWVSLVSLQQAQQVISAILNALSLSPGSNPEAQLLEYLEDKSILLVLDNFEQLLAPGCSESQAAVAWIQKIIEHTREIKLLVTSRERLCLRTEWVYPLEGLPYPHHDANESPARYEQYAAIELFIRRARQFQPTFPAREDAYQHIARISRLVSGVPLGIELASGWVGQLSCQEIAAQLESDLDFLVSSFRDIPDRHQSLRAVFETSWKMLTPEEQQVLRRLSLFHSPFSRTDAQEVAGASIAQLASLANKSLLHETSGLYSMHLVVQQYLAQKLAEDLDEEQATRFAHAVHISNFLAELEWVLTVQNQPAALEQVQHKISDVHASWEWAASQGNWDLLSQFLDSLYYYHWARNQYAEGQALLEQALDGIRLSGEEQNQMLAARLRIRIADYHYWQGNLSVAQEKIRKSLPVFQSAENLQEQAGAHDLLGRIAYAQGNFRHAREEFNTAIGFARQSGQAQVLAQALCSLADVICEEYRDYPVAGKFYSESLSLFRQLDNPFGMARVLINQGSFHNEQGNFVQAAHYYQESLEQYRALDYTYGISASLNNLAILARKQGNLQQARELIEESLILKRKTGNRIASLHALLELGLVECEAGETALAQEHLLKGLQQSVQLNASSLFHFFLLGLASYYETRQQHIRAAEIVYWVLSHEEAGQETLDQAKKQITNLESRLAPDKARQCRQRAAGTDRAQLLSDLLNGYYPPPAHEDL